MFSCVPHALKTTLKFFLSLHVFFGTLSYDPLFLSLPHPWSLWTSTCPKLTFQPAAAEYRKSLEKVTMTPSGTWPPPFQIQCKHTCSHWGLWEHCRAKCPTSRCFKKGVIPPQDLSPCSHLIFNAKGNVGHSLWWPTKQQSTSDGVGSIVQQDVWKCETKFIGPQRQPAWNVCAEQFEWRKQWTRTDKRKFWIRQTNQGKCGRQNNHAKKHFKAASNFLDFANIDSPSTDDLKWLLTYDRQSAPTPDKSSPTTSHNFKSSFLTVPHVSTLKANKLHFLAKALKELQEFGFCPNPIAYTPSSNASSKEACATNLGKHHQLLKSRIFVLVARRTPLKSRINLGCCHSCSNCLSCRHHTLPTPS